MTDTDDMRGPWALALGMAAIAAGTVAVSTLRRLARRRDDPDDSDRERAGPPGS
ncbi:hypothetical protein [Halomarina litorea]|uniref:hypothetical protein n=1 Tax=Halomarina litorea TaxID=2961595 RepID=UPI0020C3EE81|nr:hypothetical protein [Halomarina sp. BCD28]